MVIKQKAQKKGRKEGREGETDGQMDGGMEEGNYYELRVKYSGSVGTRYTWNMSHMSKKFPIINIHFKGFVGLFNNKIKQFSTEQGYR